jgi:hypothetical protein
MVAVAPGNFKERLYNKNGFKDDKKVYPNRLIIGSEVFPYYRGREESMRDYFPKNPWYDVAENDFVFGQFLWAGVDYLSGSGKLIGLNNGDFRSDEPFKGDKRTTYFGKALAVIQSLRRPGYITLKVSATGLPKTTIIIKGE